MLLRQINSNVGKVLSWIKIAYDCVKQACNFNKAKTANGYRCTGGQSRRIILISTTGSPRGVHYDFCSRHAEDDF